MTTGQRCTIEDAITQHPELTLVQIAKNLGISMSTVYTVIREAGARLRRPRGRKLAMKEMA
jgi:DNA-directed RNA polymerase specialized sigma24 family protein